MCHEINQNTTIPLFSKSILIRGKKIENRLFLSPMTVVGNVALREVILGYGGVGLLFAEMCNAKMIPFENRDNSAYFKWSEAERSILVSQIFGNNPDVMARAAQRIEKEDHFGVDINFGCSARLICARGGGAAILKTPELAVKIVSAVREAVDIPVFVKFRTGWKDDPGFAKDMAKRFEDAGADALTFHPRVAPDVRSRPPKWEYIKEVKKAVSIPVFGNGNVFCRQDGIRMMQTTQCDGISIGRLALVKPWLFSQWTGGYKPDRDIYFNVAHSMLTLLIKYYEDTDALRRFKRYSYYFAANFKFGHSLHKKVLGAKRTEDIRQIIDQFFENPPDLLQQPNLNFL